VAIIRDGLPKHLALLLVWVSGEDVGEIHKSLIDRKRRGGKGDRDLAKTSRTAENDKDIRSRQPGLRRRGVHRVEDHGLGPLLAVSSSLWQSYVVHSCINACMSI